MARAPLLDGPGFNQLVRGRDAYYLYNVNDSYVGRSIERYAEYAGLEARFLERLCGEGDVVLEVGANIGAHTVALAKRVGPRGRVLAFEPQRLPFQALCANVALNSLANVDCHWAAVGARRGTIRVPELDPSQPANFGGVSLAAVTEGHIVPCFALDDFAGLPRVKLLKIDVEGMEAEVLHGGRKLIERFSPHLYVENDRVDRSEALMRLIDSLGYRLYWHTPPLYDPDNAERERVDLFPNVRSFNLLCVHRDAPSAVAGATPVEDFTAHPLKRDPG
jgi:FkbM family methyltransferase